MKNNYFNVFTKSHYSIGRAIRSPKEIIKRAIEVGHSAACIVDKHSTAAMLELYSASRNKDLLADSGYNGNYFPVVLGVSVNVTDDLLVRDSDRPGSDLILLAKNQAGYKNICKLSSIGYDSERFFEVPRISFDDLRNNSEGIVAIDTGEYSVLANHLKDLKRDQAVAAAKVLKEIFKDDFYLFLDLSDNRRRWNPELRKMIDHGINDLVEYNSEFLKIADELNIRTGITFQSLMASPQDLGFLQLMMKDINKIKGEYEPAEFRFLCTLEQLKQRALEKFKFISDEEFTQLLATVNEVLEKCQNIKLNFNPQIPKINHREHPLWSDQGLQKDANELIAKLDADEKYKGIAQIAESDDAIKLSLMVAMKSGKLRISDPIYLDRFITELRDVQLNGRIKLLDYFLFLEDTYQFCVRNNIYRGKGRGSAGGSYLASCLNITDLDPIKWDLLWSRFYTPDRAGVFKFKFSPINKESL